MGSGSDVARRLGAVRERIARAAARAGRDPAAITLVAVTKTVTPPRIAEAIEAGQRDFGENRVQEALEKIPHLPPVRWHMIGHLQRNKARKVVGRFELIHSVDTPRLVDTLDRLGRERGLVVRTLIEVNVGGEASKSGIAPEELPALLDHAAGREGLSVEGLMTVPPWTDDPQDARPYFAALARLREREAAVRRPGVRLAHLSMGMSHDFEVAIEEGATIVRVGSAIFGPRPPASG
ncbi:MAG: YggS family pyridoxal phosphate-dependent enzyme [Acidobacteriota bacterium]